MSDQPPTKFGSRAEPRASTPKGRKGKALLVAAIGVATVSYLKGCAEDHQSFSSGNLLPGPPDPALTRDAAADGAAPSDASLPGSGNLLPPPGDASLPPVSGNLLPPPGDASLPPVSGNLLPPPPDASLPPSGNLVPPPPPSDAGPLVDAGPLKDAELPPAPSDAGKPNDAQVKDALPPVGNLLPPAPQE